MRWKQFFTPVESISTEQGKKLIEERGIDSLTILDVRQRNEYAKIHIPGAKLIPLPELGNRLGELDTGKATLVYWAVGGRSRVAAQMLSSRGFREVYNVAGGIKAWHGNIAFGPEDMGLELFDGNETADTTLTVAYSLEQGLREFYLSMERTQSDIEVTKLFKHFAAIEMKHQETIFAEYLRVTGKDLSRDDFEKSIVVKAVEGGLTTDQYIQRFKPDLNSAQEVVALAMSIEAQALDMYQRAADRSSDIVGKQVLTQIASEEQMHLQLLGKLMDSL